MKGAAQVGIHTVAFGRSAAASHSDDSVVNYRLENPLKILDIVVVDRE